MKVCWVGLSLFRCREFHECRNQEQGLEELNARIRAYYHTHKPSSRVPTLTMENISSKGWPDFRGPAVKAANTRNLYRFASELARELDDGSRELKRRYNLCQSLFDLSEMIDHGPMFFDVDQHAKFVRLTHIIQTTYSWLAQNSINRGEFAWKVTPKLHLMAHLADQASVINPRFVRCYRQESGMGKIQRIYMSQMRGPHMDRIQKATLLKQLIALHVTWAVH